MNSIPSLSFLSRTLFAAAFLLGLPPVEGETVSESFDQESEAIFAEEGTETKSPWTVVIPVFKYWQGGLRSVAELNPSGGVRLEPTAIRNAPPSSPDHYSVSVDLCLNNVSNTSWAGIVFDYQESGACCWFRISGEGNVQVVRCLEDPAATDKSLFNPGANGGREPEFSTESGIFYRLTLSRKDVELFSVEVRNRESGEILYTGEWEPKSTEVPGNGRFGLKGNRSTTDFDNFDIR